MILKTLGFSAVPLHGQLSQSLRLGALAKFKSGGRNILVATDVASRYVFLFFCYFLCSKSYFDFMCRGLDIPSVDIVINYDIPSHSKDYIHRVGRTARAGRAGKSITIVTQYDVELVLRIENVIDKKMELWPTDAEEVALMRERVDEAGRLAATELKEQARENKGGKKRRNDLSGADDRDRDDDIAEAGLPVRRPKKSRR